MKKGFLLFLFCFGVIAIMHSQTQNEFVLEKFSSATNTIQSRCKEDGHRLATVEFFTAIKNVEFETVANNRIVSNEYDERRGSYILCLRGVDKDWRYIQIDISKSGYMLYSMEAIQIKNGEYMAYKLSPKYDDTPNSSVSNNSFNGHEYVDLGLPSGTLWATCNVGASKPEDAGGNFAWGETTEKSNYNLETYKYFNGSSGKVTKYCNDSYFGDRGFTDNLKILQSSDDPATANCGRGWHTPTKAQWEELINYTIHEWKEQNGTDGMLFTAKNGRALFLPIVGYCWGSGYLYSGASPYWSMSLYTDCPSDAWCISFNKNGCSMSQGNRANGFHVRPVREK
jgi:hypothetical protein